MSRIFLNSLLVGLLAMLAANASAAGLELVCSCTYNISGGQVTLTAEHVENHRDSGTSGTLKLKLWATATPYSGGAISGYILGQYQFTSTLEHGWRFSDVNRTVTYNAPPDGTYYITMTLTEYDDGADWIQDSVNFPNTLVVGDGGGSNTTRVFQISAGEYANEYLDPGSTHIYEISLSSAGTLVLNSSGDLDTVARLYATGSGKLISEDDDSGSDYNFMMSVALAAGGYELHVQGVNSGTQGSYFLYSKFTPDSYNSLNETRLSSIITSDGSSTSANFGIGVTARGNAFLEDDFSTGDQLLLSGSLYPQAADIGLSGEIYVVIRVDTATSKKVYYQDLDGVLRSWSGRLPELQPAYEKAILSNTENFTILDSQLTAGDYRIFLGYRLASGFAPLHFNSRGYRLQVQNLDTYASLGGKVIDGATGQPVTSAEVEVFGFVEGFYSTRVYTDNKGDYFIRVLADRLNLGNTFYARAAAEGCNPSQDYSDIINNDNHAVIDFILDCGSSDDNNGGNVDTGTPSLTVTSAECEAERFSFGTIAYNKIHLTGTATGPVGAWVSGIGDFQCASWTNCERQPNEPASTTWYNDSTSGAWSPQSQVVYVYGPVYDASERVEYSCPII